MEKLIFIKGKVISKPKEKPVIWSADRGYYFKGQFLAKLKNHALKEIRQKYFKTYSDEEKQKYKDEWAVLTYEGDKVRKKIKNTEKKKQGYYLKRRIECLRDKINNLNFERIKAQNTLIKLKDSYYKAKRRNSTKE